MQEFYVVGDIHHRHGIIEEVIAIAGDKPVVWLGDFYDNWNDQCCKARETAEKVARLVLRKQDKFCLSNHDVSYRFPMNERFRGWGFTHEKCRVIHSVFPVEAWKRFKVFHTVEYLGQNIVLSHAGFTESTLPNGKFDEPFLRRVEMIALGKGQRAVDNPMLDSEHGPLWKRWPLPLVDGICQVVGHTPCSVPQVVKKSGRREWNLCLDCAYKYIAHFTPDGVFAVDITNGNRTLMQFCNNEIG